MIGDMSDQSMSLQEQINVIDKNGSKNLEELYKIVDSIESQVESIFLGARISTWSILTNAGQGSGTTYSVSGICYQSGSFVL
jgi:hypothetical protein